MKMAFQSHRVQQRRDLGPATVHQGNVNALSAQLINVVRQVHKQW
jgi:hypothetical protein